MSKMDKEEQALVNDFAAWVSKKPATENYNFNDLHFCAVGQYTRMLPVSKEMPAYSALHRLLPHHVLVVGKFGKLSELLKGYVS